MFFILILRMFRNVEDSSSRVQRASFVSGRSSRSSEEKQGISNGHGYHHGCTCEKCSQRSVLIQLFSSLDMKVSMFRKEEKRMLIEYNEKLRALIQEKEKIIKRLYTENNTIKQCKEVIIRLITRSKTTFSFMYIISI